MKCRTGVWYIDWWGGTHFLCTSDVEDTLLVWVVHSRKAHLHGPWVRTIPRVMTDLRLLKMSVGDDPRCGWKWHARPEERESCRISKARQCVATSLGGNRQVI